jgi:hypothetical protein
MCVYLGCCLKIYWIHQFMAIYIAENMIIYDNQSVDLNPIFRPIGVPFLSFFSLFYSK